MAKRLRHIDTGYEKIGDRRIRGTVRQCLVVMGHIFMLRSLIAMAGSIHCLLALGGRWGWVELLYIVCSFLGGILNLDVFCFPSQWMGTWHKQSQSDERKRCGIGSWVFKHLHYRADEALGSMKRFQDWMVLTTDNIFLSKPNNLEFSYFIFTSHN